jgi:hypothetical protein
MVASAEQRVRAVWHPGITISQIEREASVSRSTGHKYNRLLQAEQERQEEQAQ